MTSRILIPLDGSRTSEAALDEAIRQATAFDLPVHLVRVVDTHVLEQVGGSAAAFNYTVLGEMFEQESAEAGSYLDEITKRLEGEGLTATREVLIGPIARSILDEVESGDMIVMGSHGRSGIRRWVLGSIAEDVLRDAYVPVLLVKHPHPQS
ncbi:MAG TPA: universal stress protein [Thermomicrobiales bacterium]|nr:universal stress protein [Thermomicrobiales bacterium]